MKRLKILISFCACFAGHLAYASEFDCLIEPKQTIEIRPGTEGLITRVLVQRGDMVKAGQLLVELDPGLDRASVEAARYRSTMEGAVRSKQSRIEFLKQKLARREDLARENFVSPQDRDETAAEYKLAEAELLDAQEMRTLAGLEHRRTTEQLRLRTIRSPIDGVVVDRMMNPGELADNRDLRKPILKLAELSTLYVEVLLPVWAYRQVKVGQPIDVIVQQPVEGRFQAKVSVIDKVFDAASRTFGVRLDLPNPSATIPAGIKCRASFSGVAEPKDSKTSRAAP